MKLKLKARVSRSDARTIRHAALGQLPAKREEDNEELTRHCATTAGFGFQETRSAGICRPEGVRNGSGVSEVQAAFVTSLASVYGSHDDRAWRLRYPTLTQPIVAAIAEASAGEYKNGNYRFRPS
jgi:hypothetical protein